MLSLAAWRELGSPGIFTIRRNKGKGRVDYTHIQRRGTGYEVRMVRSGGGIFYYWHARLEDCGYRLDKQGTATTLEDLVGRGEGRSKS